MITPTKLPSQGIDTPSDEFYNINTTHASPPMSSRHKMSPRLPRPNSGPNQFRKKQPNQKWTGPIYLPGHVYKLLRQEAKEALQKYNVEAIEKFKSRTVHEMNFVSDIHEDSQDIIASSNKEIKDEDTKQNHPDQDIEIPKDDLLDFINHQNHTDDQLDQVLQTYQAYTKSHTPSRVLMPILPIMEIKLAKLRIDL